MQWTTCWKGGYAKFTPVFFAERKLTIAAGYGWYPLLISLFRALGELAAYFGAQFTGSQIKEKFGQLRVYLSTRNNPDPDTKEIATLLVDTAEFLSGHQCEICGEVGSLHKVGYWYRVRCARHVNNQENTGRS